MICEYQDRDFGSFEQMRPAAESSHDSEELAVIYGVILLGGCEFLGMESHWSPWSWFFFAVWFHGWWIPLVQYGTCADL